MKLLLHPPRRDFVAFTLIELLLVSVVLAIVAGMIAPNFFPTYSQLKSKQSLNDLTTLMRYAQGRSVAKGRMHQLRFDQDFSSFQLLAQTEGSSSEDPEFEILKGRWGKLFNVPDDWVITSRLQAIHFYPDGTIEKAEIDIQSSRKQWTISTILQKGFVHVILKDEQEKLVD